MLLGRPLRSDRAAEALLPVFASDALSSVTCAPQEVLLVLSIGGLALLHLAPWVALAEVVRALAFARANRPDPVVALTVDERDTEVLRRERQRWDVGVPLEVVESPCREIARPVVDRATHIRRAGPATWCASTSRSTWSGAGGRTCCTTRARRAWPGGCGSSRGARGQRAVAVALQPPLDPP